MSAGMFWLMVGFAAQAVFMSRFVVQWLASERAGESVVPLVFWRLSCCGGVMMLLYACSRRDPVVMLGQATGLAIYARNLALARPRRSVSEAVGQSSIARIETEQAFDGFADVIGPHERLADEDGVDSAGFEPLDIGPRLDSGFAH